EDDTRDRNVTGVQTCTLQISHADGKALQAVTERKETGEIVELQVPPSLTRDGSLRLTWQTKDESQLNWRQHSRLNEVWLIKKEQIGRASCRERVEKTEVFDIL